MPHVEDVGEGRGESDKSAGKEDALRRSAGSGSEGRDNVTTYRTHIRGLV